MSDRRHAVGGGNLCDADFTDWYTVDAKKMRRILVLEDINEHPFPRRTYAVAAHHAGILPRQKAIILGSFSGSTPNDYDAGYNLSQYAFLRSRLSIPHYRPRLVMNNALHCRWAHAAFLITPRKAPS